MCTVRTLPKIKADLGSARNTFRPCPLRPRIGRGWICDQLAGPNQAANWGRLLAMRSSGLSDADVIAHAAAGTLLRKMAKDKALVTQAVALHQAYKLDLLALINTQAFSALDGHDFFAVQHEFCQVIPELKASVPQMMAAIKALVEKGGQDLAAHLPERAFRTWLDRDLGRAGEIVAISDGGAKVDRRFLLAAVEALGDATLDERWAKDGDVDRRSAGLAALGGITPANPAEAEHHVQLLLSFAGADYDEDTRFVALLGAYRQAEKVPRLASVVVNQATALVSDAPTDAALFALVRALWLHSKAFEPKEASAALAVLANHIAGKPGLMNELDPALGDLVEHGNRDAVLGFLDKVLASEEPTVTLGTFDNLEYHLRQQDRDFLFGLAVRWLRTGKRGLCEAVAALIGGAHELTPFERGLSGFGLSGQEMVVLCHKAIAYLLLTPVLAASFVVAALRAGDKTVESELVDLLSQAVLENFGGKARDYLKAIRKGDAAYAGVRKALKANGAYLKGLDLPAAIRELHPSPAQRAVAAEKQLEMGKDIRRRAEAQSVFMNLVHRSTILYGHRSLSYIGGKDKPPVTLDLKSFGTEFEMPRLNIIDPVGLDYLMRIFRLSRAP